MLKHHYFLFITAIITCLCRKTLPGTEHSFICRHFICPNNRSQANKLSLASLLPLMVIVRLLSCNHCRSRLPSLNRQHCIYIVNNCWMDAKISHLSSAAAYFISMKKKEHGNLNTFFLCSASPLKFAFTTLSSSLQGENE